MAYSSFAELSQAARESGSLAKAVTSLEAQEANTTPEAVRAHMHEALSVMRESVARGLTGEVRSRSGMTGGDAALLAESSSGPVGGIFTDALAAALATGEVNAAMGASSLRRRAAPRACCRRCSSPSEVGAGLPTTSSSMRCSLPRVSAASSPRAPRSPVQPAAARLRSAAERRWPQGPRRARVAGTVEQVGHASSLAMQGLLGLVCDPIGGLVEVPCVARNATGAAVALAAVEMALAGVEFPMPFDEVVDARRARRPLPSARHSGRLPVEGLAVTPTGKPARGRSFFVRPRRVAAATLVGTFS